MRATHGASLAWMAKPKIWAMTTSLMAKVSRRYLPDRWVASMSILVEKKRILDAGGYVENRRVNGKWFTITVRNYKGADECFADNLGLSRAFGDFQFKANKTLPPEKQIITADPDINHREITDEDEFLILACDGLYCCCLFLTLETQSLPSTIHRYLGLSVLPGGRGFCSIPGVKGQRCFRDRRIDNRPLSRPD